MICIHFLIIKAMNKLVKNAIALCTGILIMAVSVVPSTFAQATFSDVPQNHPFYQDIMLLSQLGVVGGYQDGTFKPGNPVDRAAALKMILVGSQVAVEAATQAPFPDVNPGEWFAPYIAKAKQLGIVKGNPDGTYRPWTGVSKAEFMKMLLAANGVDLSKHQNLTQAVATDVPADAWFAPYFSYSKTAGITTPAQDGSLNPGKQLSRGEVAAFMARLIRLKQGGDTQQYLNTAETKLIDAINGIRAKDIAAAEKAAREAVVAAGTAVQQKPNEPVVIAAATISVAFEKLVASYKSGINEKFGEAIELANEAKEKATRAAEIFEGVKAISDQLKAFADQVITEATTAAGQQTQTQTGDTAAQIQQVQTQIQELTNQCNAAMTQLQQQLQQLQGTQATQ